MRSLIKRPCLPLALAAALAVMLTGCTSSPWSAGRPSAPSTAVSPAQAASGPVLPNQPATAAPSATTPDAQAMQQVLAEMEQLGEFDQAAKEKLSQDLQNTDPSLWPLMVQQFRAAIAYRRQALQRRAQQQQMAAAAFGQGAPGEMAPGQVAPNQAAPGQAPACPSGSPAAAQADRTAPHPNQPGAGSGQAQPAAQQGGGAAGQIARLPVADQVALAPKAAPSGDYPQTEYPASPQGPAGQPAEDQPKSAGASEQVVNASYNRQSPADWRTHLDAAIRAKEAELRGGAKTPEEEAQHAQLRMLYLLAGRRDDALRPIPLAAPLTQGFWSEELYGLAAWLDTQRTADASRRAAEAKQHLNEAVTKLSQSAPLLVRNVAFCSKIQSYGCIRQFEKYEFSPGQDVLLYAEIENLGSEATPQGVHTSLHSGYQIFDSRGQRVADNEFTVTEEYCRNPRHDYFIGYELRLPQRIYPGKHTLQLTIEDLKSHKIGQSSIEFAIKKADR